VNDDAKEVEDWTAGSDEDRADGNPDRRGQLRTTIWTTTTPARMSTGMTMGV
jgi:hypothetical protein